MNTPTTASKKRAAADVTDTAADVSDVITPALASPTQREAAPPAEKGDRSAGKQPRLGQPSLGQPWYYHAPTASNTRASAITPAPASPTQRETAHPVVEVVRPAEKQPRLGEPRQRDQIAILTAQVNNLLAKTLTNRQILDIADRLYGTVATDIVIKQLDKSFKSMVEDNGLVKVQVMYYLDLTVKEANRHHVSFARSVTTTNVVRSKTTEFIFQMPTVEANQILPFIVHSSNGKMTIVGASVLLPVRCEVYAKQVSARWGFTVHIPQAYGGDTFTISKTDLLRTALEDNIGESLM
jgi:hypothetical protein